MGLELQKEQKKRKKALPTNGSISERVKKNTRRLQPTANSKAQKVKIDNTELVIKYACFRY